MNASRLPKAKANAHPSTRAAPPPPSRTLPHATSPTTHSLLHTLFQLSFSRLLSRLCIISRPAFLATSFTLLLSGPSPRSKRKLITTPPAPLQDYRHHTLSTPTNFASFRHRRFLASPKKTWGTLLGGDTKRGSWIFILDQRHRQSNLPYRDNLPQHHQLATCTTTSGHTSNNSAFWLHTLHPGKRLGWSGDYQGVVDDEPFRLQGGKTIAESFTFSCLTIRKLTVTRFLPLALRAGCLQTSYGII